MTYSPEPPMAGILYSRLIPPRGGDTLWADMHAAYLALSGSLRSLLDPLDAVHDLAKAFPPEHRAVRGSGSGQYEDKMQANPPVLHPVVQTHPETGEDCLFVNEGFTTAIQGLAKKESDDLLAFLFAHVNKPEFSMRWRWKPNTLAMWDNRCTQHYAVNDYLPHRRVMHRATLKGSRPFNRSRPGLAGWYRPFIAGISQKCAKSCRRPGIAGLWPALGARRSGCRRDAGGPGSNVAAGHSAVNLRDRIEV
jgi:taurine dioxygenase